MKNLSVEDVGNIVLLEHVNRREFVGNVSPNRSCDDRPRKEQTGLLLATQLHCLVSTQGLVKVVLSR